jgi:hypothetical protein
MVKKTSEKPLWSPTWFKRHMVLATMEDATETQTTGKRKKTTQTSITNQQVQSSRAHHSHIQQATKILSNASLPAETKGNDNMAQDITELKERNVKLMTMITEMKELQYWTRIQARND